MIMAIGTENCFFPHGWQLKLFMLYQMSNVAGQYIHPVYGCLMYCSYSVIISER